MRTKGEGTGWIEGRYEVLRPQFPSRRPVQGSGV